MSLFQIPDNSASADAAAEQIATAMNSTFDAIKLGHQRVFELFWKHPTATPQQIADALQAKGWSPQVIFDLGHDAVVLLLKGRPDALKPEEYTPTSPVAFDEGGGVTIG